MATDSVMGLFATPQMIQQQQYNDVLNQNIRMAQLTPIQQATAQARTAGYQLGGAIGGALGAQDPQLQAASIRQQVIKGVDWNDPTSIATASRSLLERGDAMGSQQLAALAQQARDKQLATVKTTSEIAKNLREGVKVDKVGVAESTREPVYMDKVSNQQFIIKTDPNTGQQVRVPYNGGIDQLTAKTNIDARNIGETAFSKELGALDAKKVSEAMTSRGAAIDQLKTLQKMAEVDQRPVISGTLAAQRTDVSNFFNTIGLASSADRIKTANSQEYIKYSTGLVLDNLKKTGYNPSNADMKVVQSLIPRLETDPIARKELIKFMAEKANEVVTESNNLETFARTNKGLSGYTPKVPQVTFGNTAPNPAAGLTDAQLKAIAGIQ